jgi:hypothetical protein
MMLEGYPKPRYPKFKRPKSAEDLMPKARDLVGQPPGRHEHSLKPSYDIRKGDRILWVVENFPAIVVEAMRRAMQEKGACVDVFNIDNAPNLPPHEIEDELEIKQVGLKADVKGAVRIPGANQNTITKLVEAERYSFVISGWGGPPPKTPYRQMKFNFITLEDWFSPMMTFPPEVQEAIDYKVDRQIRSAVKMRATDPEGSDMTWTNYDDKRVLNAGHHFAHPLNIGYGNDGYDDMTGVYSGCIGHAGAYPNVKVYFENGVLQKVEGGGKVGALWQEKVEKYKNFMYPPLDVETDDPAHKGKTFQIKVPGFFQFWEYAIGTVPGAFRDEQSALLAGAFNFIHERIRAGYVHCGFGPAPRWANRADPAGVIIKHMHIHHIFPTLEGTTASGEHFKIIDKGHLTALDDPEVRKVTSKFGDPDELLKEIWIPAIPGINVPGDYMRDYGRDPIPWILKEAKEHPLWVD